MANISTSTLHEADEAHYDVPWEFIHRTKSSPNQNDRPHSECTESLSVNRIDASLLKSPKYCVRASEYSQRYSAREKPDKFSASPSLKNHKFHRVSSSSPIEKLSAQPSNVDNGRNGLKQNLDELRKRLNETGIVKRERYHEEELVHRGVDRLEAERRLLNCRLGSFLVRVRDNGNLALSIRANKGILHIKLELRDDRWVLGEGPSFGSVSTVVSFYRSHELPIRGAERMLLSSPLLVSSSSSSQSSLSSVNSRSFV